MIRFKTQTICKLQTNGAHNFAQKILSPRPNRGQQAVKCKLSPVLFPHNKSTSRPKPIDGHLVFVGENGGMLYVLLVFCIILLLSCGIVANFVA